MRTFDPISLSFFPTNDALCLFFMIALMRGKKKTLETHEMCKEMDWALEELFKLNSMKFYCARLHQITNIFPGIVC